MFSSNMLFCIGFLIGCLAALSNVISIAINLWTCKETDLFGTHVFLSRGLWRTCVETVPMIGKSKDTCSKILEPEDYESTTRYFVFIGLVMICISMVITCAYKCFLNDLPLLSIFGSFCMVLAGFLTWIGTIVYGNDHLRMPGNTPEQVHAGWALALSSSLLCFISGSVFAVSKIHGHYSNTSV